jgi:hypothetical protein
VSLISKLGPPPLKTRFTFLPRKNAINIRTEVVCFITYIRHLQPQSLQIILLLTKSPMYSVNSKRINFYTFFFNGHGNYPSYSRYHIIGHQRHFKEDVAASCACQVIGCITKRIQQHTQKALSSKTWPSSLTFTLIDDAYRMHIRPSDDEKSDSFINYVLINFH